MPLAETRGPIDRLADGRLVPTRRRPASHFAQALLLRALERVRPYVRGRVLSVGCGERPCEWLFAEQIEKYYGVDWLESGRPRPGTTAAADAQLLPFRDASFDTVLCTEVMEHLPRPADCLREIARVLVPGGKAIFSTPFLFWVHEEPHDYFRFTPFGLTALAREQGLEPIHLGVRGDLPAVLLDIWGRWVWSAARSRLRVEWLARGVLAVVAGIPQRLYLRNYAGQATDGLPTVTPHWTLPQKAALGYVVVAQRPLV